MICVGIDVAKNKHDCYILDSDGRVLSGVFTIPNTLDGFQMLLNKIRSYTEDPGNVKVGLEATGHYSYNILGFLLDNGLPTYVINPLQTNFYRNSLSLRKTKTDRIDSRTIATMLMSDVSLKPYTVISYHIEGLKSLTRYRFDRVQFRAKLRVSVTRLVDIVFPELEGLVSSLHTATVYALLKEFPGAQQVAQANLTHLKTLLSTASRGRYGREKAIEIREAARHSIGSSSAALALELKHTLDLISVLDKEIAEIDASIDAFMEELASPITTIPGIGNRMGAMILAEIGDFSRFSSPDKILAYAGMSPSTYQSGQMRNCYAHMEKRGSRYLRYALFNSAKYVCMWDPVFRAYLDKKRAEGKHYNVAVTHAVKKLVRVIYHLVKTGQAYNPAAA